jgi:hypothetical protein
MESAVTRRHELMDHRSSAISMRESNGEVFEQGGS